MGTFLRWSFHCDSLLQQGAASNYQQGDTEHLESISAFSHLTVHIYIIRSIDYYTDRDQNQKILALEYAPVPSPFQAPTKHTLRLTLFPQPRVDTLHILQMGTEFSPAEPEPSKKIVCNY